MKKLVIIGGGVAGLSAACFLAKAGCNVTVLDNHSQPGGRVRQLKEAGFTFDMGPSWYWMPDVFERFFGQFGKSVSEYYRLTRLDPSYRIYADTGEMDVPASYEELQQLFEKLEPGAAAQLQLFIDEAACKYNIGMKKLVYQPGLSATELLHWDVIGKLGKLDVFTSMKSHVSGYFKHPLIRKMMEFPVLFLGALPSRVPALYSLMNHADIIGGTWYPQGGMYRVVQAMYSLARELGVNFAFNTPAHRINVQNNKATGVETVNGFYRADAVLGAGDYHHMEQLLKPEFRSYTQKYWNSRLMAPGCLLFYVGLNKKLPGITHHSLFFDADFEQHSRDIYEAPAWPSDPLFYMSATSATDEDVAPPGGENLFLLMPVAAGLSDDSTATREKYFDMMVSRLEKKFNTGIREAIVYKSSFSYSEFVSEYNSFKGNAYGLANTLMQTAVLKPRCRSKKVSNLFYAGQLTVPGPGVPPALISGEVVAGQVMKLFAEKKLLQLQ